MGGAFILYHIFCIYDLYTQRNWFKMKDANCTLCRLYAKTYICIEWKREKHVCIFFLRLSHCDVRIEQTFQNNGKGQLGLWAGVSGCPI